MPKPICVPCERFYRPEKNGFPFVEGMPKFSGAKPGKDHADDWQAYKLWVGDKWKCPGCGHEIVVGALHHVSEHYLPAFKQQVEALKPTVTVNDC